jgi:hypothetical protein
MHREFLSILPVFSSLEVQTRNGEGYREETAFARSIYLAEARAPAFAGVQLYLPSRSVTFRKVSRFSLYLLAPAIPRADGNSEPDGFAGSACPGALAGHSLLREKPASPTATGTRKSVSQPHP